LPAPTTSPRPRSAQSESAGTTGGTLLFPVILACYFIGQTLLRLWMPDTLQHDEAQQIFVSQFLAVGYDGQPPLYNWLQYGAVHLFGMSLVSLALLKNLILFATYFLFWKTAGLILDNRKLAITATLGLLTIPQLAFESQRDLTHTVAVFFSATLFAYALIRTVKHPNAFNYVLTGLAIGLGALSKYNFVLLPIAACLALLLDRDMRRHVLDIRLALTALVAAAIVLPHGLWFFDHMGRATGTALKKMVTEDTSYAATVFWGLGSLAVAVIGFTALTAICFAIAFRENLRAALQARDPWIRFFERTTLFVIAGLALMVVFGGVDSIRDRWLAPYLVTFPLYLCLRLDRSAAALDLGRRRFKIIAAGLMVLIPLLLIGMLATVHVNGKYEYINTPFAALADDIEDNAGTPAVYVTSETHLSGNLHFQRPDVPAVALSYPQFEPAYDWTKEHPIVLVWRQSKGRTPPPFPNDLKAWLEAKGISPAVAEPRVVKLPYIYGRPGDVYQFAYMVIYPDS
jgi:lipopolysaccharide core galacturonosyltransferase RgtB